MDDLLPVEKAFAIVYWGGMSYSDACFMTEEKFKFMRDNLHEAFREARKCAPKEEYPPVALQPAFSQALKAIQLIYPFRDVILKSKCDVLALVMADPDTDYGHHAKGWINLENLVSEQSPVSVNLVEALVLEMIRILTSDLYKYQLRQEIKWGEDVPVGFKPGLEKAKNQAVCSNYSLSLVSEPELGGIRLTVNNLPTNLVFKTNALESQKTAEDAEWVVCWHICNFLDPYEWGGL